MSDPKKVFPLAYELEPNLQRTLCFVGFPQRWKSELLQIDRALRPGVRAEYALPTNVLKRMILAWMDHAADLAPLKMTGDDSHWLTSCAPFGEDALKELCDYVRIWCLTTYRSHKRMTPSLSGQLEAFCASMKWEELRALQVQEQVRLTAEDGTVHSEAYGTIPLLAVNQLLGKSLLLGNTRLQLACAGKNELITHPLEDPETHEAYSFWLRFTLQTTPPDRHALLLCHMGIRRWIQAPRKAEEVPYPVDAVSAHIRTGPDKYCRVEIRADYHQQQIQWNPLDRDCYHILCMKPLPDAKQVFCHPQDYKPEILLPYKNGMLGFAASRIGTGVSVPDKKALYTQLIPHLSGLIRPDEVAAELLGRRKNIKTLDAPSNYDSPEAFRAWVRSSVGYSELHFELYYLLQDPEQAELMEAVAQKIQDDFGENRAESCMHVEIHRCSLGDLALGLRDTQKQTMMRHSKELAAMLDPPRPITGSFVLIPDAAYYRTQRQGDPKPAIRNAFALTGRVVQFLTLPEAAAPGSRRRKDSARREKVIHSVYDLYRQLGLVSLIDFSGRTSPMLSTACVGLHICSKIPSKQRKGCNLPLCIRTDLQTGRVTVSCDLFPGKTVSYRQACLEMAKLFWKDDLEKLCTEAGMQSVKHLLLRLKTQYRSPSEPVLLTVAADGNTRALWSGISDKELRDYEMLGPYRPEAIDSGKKGTLLELDGSGIRIFRIRVNQEVPDYFTAPSAVCGPGACQYASTSGVFRYRQTFWSIMSRDKDSRYIDSLKQCRIDHPSADFAEKDMTELYPVQLQADDAVSDWVFFADSLRTLALQYHQATVLPLPLHLAKCLEEYLFDF